jgi:hypothetical protein
VAPQSILKWFLLAWLGAVTALVTYRILTGRIALTGLLTMDGSRFSPERLQMLLVSLGALAVYAGGTLEAGKMTDIPDWIVAILTGSNVLYLGGKVAGR